MLGDPAILKDHMSNKHKKSNCKCQTASGSGVQTKHYIKDTEEKLDEGDEKIREKDLDSTEENLEELTEEDEDKNQKASEVFRKLDAVLQVYSEPVTKSERPESPVTDEEEKEASAFMARIIEMRKATSERRKTTCECESSESDFDVVSILKRDQEVERRSWGIDEDDEEEEVSWSRVTKNRQLRLTSSGVVDMDDPVRKQEFLEWLRRKRSNTLVTPVGSSTYNFQPTRIVEIQHLPGADRSVFVYCNICKKNVRTIISYEKGTCTYIAFAFCVIFPLFILCAWIPFVFTDFMDVKHTCPICGTKIGIFNRF